MENFTVFIRESHRILRCISCNINEIPSAYTTSSDRLETIDFSNSHMKNLEINRLMLNPDALIAFNVSWNLISRLNDTSLFERADQLLTIDLSHNQIRSISKNAFNRFGKLQNLNLSFNHIENLDESTFLHLQDLKVLKLNHNNLRFLRNVLNKTTSLTHLDLSRSNIISIARAIFNQTHKLQSLYLNHNQMGTIPDLQHVTELEILDLSSNQITRLFGTTFIRLKKLQILNLHDCNLAHMDAKTFSRLSSLHTLNVSHNLYGRPKDGIITEWFMVKNGFTLSFTSLEQMNRSTENLRKHLRIDMSKNGWSCEDMPEAMREVNCKGSTVSYIGCIADEYMSTSDWGLDCMSPSVAQLAEAATCATIQADNMYVFAVAIGLLCILIVLLLIGIVILLKRNRALIDHTSNSKMYFFK